MADVKISELPAATLPQAGDVAPMVSGGITVKTTASQITTAALNATPVTVAQGGTNATTAAGARTNLGLGTIATQDASNVAITGGSINGVTIGGSTTAAGNFTSLNYSTTLTGGTGVVNLGSGQFYKDANGNFGFNTTVVDPVGTGYKPVVINAATGAAGSQLVFSYADFPNSVIGSNASGNLGIQSLGTQSFFVGGFTTPVTALSFTTAGAWSVGGGTGTAGQVLTSNGTTGVPTWQNATGGGGSFVNLSYTGTLTGGTGVVNLGSGQLYKDAQGNLGINTTSPTPAIPTFNGLTINSTGTSSSGTLIQFTYLDVLQNIIFSGNQGQLTVAANTQLTLGVNGGNGLTFNSSRAWDIGSAGYGTTGQVLTSGGSGAPPTWTTAAGGNSLQVNGRYYYGQLVLNVGPTDTFTQQGNTTVDTPVGTTIFFSGDVDETPYVVSAITFDGLITTTVTVTPDFATGGYTPVTNDRVSSTSAITPATLIELTAGDGVNFVYNRLQENLTINSTGVPGGVNTQVQYNNAGAFGGISGFTTDGTAVSVSSSNIKITGGTSGQYLQTDGAGNLSFATGANTGNITFSGSTISNNLVNQNIVINPLAVVPGQQNGTFWRAYSVNGIWVNLLPQGPNNTTGFHVGDTLDCEVPSYLNLFATVATIDSVGQITSVTVQATSSGPGFSTGDYGVGTITTAIVDNGADLVLNAAAGVASGSVYIGSATTASVVLPTVANVKIAGGTSGQVLTTDGVGNLSFTTVSGGSGTPGGSNTQLQYNNNGAFGGITGLTYDGTAINLSDPLSLTGAPGTVGQVLTSGGSGAAPTWSTPTDTPAGADTQIQFNSSGAFGASPKLTFNDATSTIAMQGQYLQYVYKGTTATSPTLRGYQSRGTATTPTTSVIGDDTFRIRSGAYTGAGPATVNGQTGWTDLGLMYNSITGISSDSTAIATAFTLQTSSLTGNNQFTFDSTGSLSVPGNMGIGTTNITPFDSRVTQLKINVPTGGLGPYLSFAYNDAINGTISTLSTGGMNIIANDYLSLQVNGVGPAVSALYINNSGAWGLGSSPISYGTTGQVLTSNGNGAPPTWADAPGGTFTNLSYSGTLTGGTGVVNIGSGQFYKDAAGNIGIGTTSAASPVTGDIQLKINVPTGAFSPYLAFAHNDVVNGTITTFNSGTMSITANSSLSFNVNGVGSALSALFINNTGAFGVGEPINYGTAGQVLTSAGSGASPTWTTPGGGGSPAGADTQIQFNDNGVFGAAANFTFASNILTIPSELQSPTATTAGDGTDLDVRAGAGNGISSVGGAARLTGGTTTGADTTGSAGGNVYVYGGSVAGTTTVGGSVFIAGGSSQLGGTGGNLYLDAGDGTTVGGTIYIGSQNTANTMTVSVNTSFNQTVGLSTLQALTTSGIVINSSAADPLLTINGSGAIQPGANGYGTSGQVLTSAGAGAAPTWTSAGSGANPAGANTQVQFNNSGAFGASADFTFDSAGGNLSTLGLIVGDNGITAAAGINLSISGSANQDVYITGSTSTTSAGLVSIDAGVKTSDLTGGDLLLGTGNGSKNINIGHIQTSLSFGESITTVVGSLVLPTVAKVTMAGGSAGQFLVTDGSSNLSFTKTLTNVTGATPLVLNSSGTNGTSLSIGSNDAAGLVSLSASSTTAGGGYFNFLIGDGTVTALAINPESDITLPAGSPTMTGGFFWIPGGDTAPTGTPTATNSGRYLNATPLYWADRTNQLYVYRRGNGSNSSWNPIDAFTPTYASMYTATGVGGTPITYTFTDDTTFYPIPLAGTATSFNTTNTPANGTILVAAAGTYQANIAINFSTPDSTGNSITYYFWLENADTSTPYANTYTSGTNVPLPDFTYTLPLNVESQIIISQPNTTVRLVGQIVYNDAQTGSTDIHIVNANLSVMQLSQRTV